VDVHDVRHQKAMRLLSICANRHVYKARANGKPLRLLMTFDNRETIRLSVAANGSGIVVDDLPLDEPFGMGGDGSIVLKDVTNELFPDLLDADVKTVRALRLGGEQVGVRICLRNEEAYDFWVDGDELFWGDRDAIATHEWLDAIIPVVAEVL
jgi:hypothetical protein